MLVLSRYPDEGITLEIPADLPAGTLVNIRLLSISHGRRASIGIEADRSIGVHRDEVYAEIVAEREQSHAADAA